MSSPITFNGFNGIDFNLILNSVMGQESQPLKALQERQNAIQTRLSTFSTLNSRVASLNTAAKALADTSAFTAFAATSTDSTAVSAKATGDAVAGHYDVVVSELARAQVTASASTAPDTDTTAVATGGSLTIKGVNVTITGAVTLRQLATAINNTDDVGVHASIVQSGAGAYRLVLTGSESGEDGAFTVVNNLTGGSGLGFTDTDNDNISGDSAADNAVAATNAHIFVNNVEAISSTNTLDEAIPGVTLTVFKKDAVTPIGVDVVEDSTAVKSKVTAFITAYNDLAKFANDQSTAASKGDDGSIGREPVLRQLRSQMRLALTAAYGSGDVTRLSQTGVEFTGGGTLKLNEKVFNAAASASPTEVKALLAGDSGAFRAIADILGAYTQAGGFLGTSTSRLTKQSSTLDSQIQNMQDRLAIRRAALQKEYAAADSAMSQLKSQSSSLSGFGSSLGSL